MKQFRYDNIDFDTVRLPIFVERFCSLMGKETQEEFGQRVGISRNSIGQYAIGRRMPNGIGIRQICERCNVSADWLIGLSDAMKPETDLQAVCEYTGLPGNVVEWLHSADKDQDAFRLMVSKVIGEMLLQLEWTDIQKILKG